jgi:glyoxylase-like metal-dependent hydrolase (beta-lactamase superfamily II)
LIELAPGVYQLALPLYAPPVVVDHKAIADAYLLRGKDGCMLIDSSWDTKEARNALERMMAEIGLGLKDIKKVVYTHLHPDHFGQAGLFKEYGVTWQAAHRLEIEYIRHRFSTSDEELGNRETRWCLSHGVPAEFVDELQRVLLCMHHMVRYIVPEVSLEDGDTIEFDPFQLKVFWTPGHAPGHICLYEPRLKLLFCGDHLTGKLPPHIPFYSAYTDDINPIGWYINSLKPMESLDVELTLPAHGREFSGLKRRLSQIGSQVEQTKEAVFGIMDGQMLTAFEVIMRKNPGLDWGKLLAIQKRGHLVETVARLQALKLEGRLEAVLHDNLVSYRRIHQGIGA